MATASQIEANRLNSQFSSGPRTTAGKINSAANAFQHGLYAKSVVIPGEDPADYEQLATDYRVHFMPETPDENFQVETLIEETWKRRRYSRIEAALMTRLIQDSGPSENPLGAVFSADNPNSRLLDRVIRARQACTRAWERAHRRLLDLKTARESLAAAPACVEPSVASPPAESPGPLPAGSGQPPIGFVPATPVPFLLRNLSQEIHPGMSKEERERILALRL